MMLDFSEKPEFITVDDLAVKVDDVKGDRFSLYECEMKLWLQKEIAQLAADKGSIAVEREMLNLRDEQLHVAIARLNLEIDEHNVWAKSNDRALVDKVTRKSLDGLHEPKDNGGTAD